MNENFPLNRFDFSALIEEVKESETVPRMLADEEADMEFYIDGDVSKEYLLCVLAEFNQIDNIAQKDAEAEYEKHPQFKLCDYQFRPSWVEISSDKVVVGYEGELVNTNFDMIFKRENGEWHWLTRKFDYPECGSKPIGLFLS